MRRGGWRRPACARAWPRLVRVFWMAEFDFAPRRGPEADAGRTAGRNGWGMHPARHPARRRGAFGRRPVKVVIRNGAGAVKIASDPERLAGLCRDRICPAGGTRCPFGDGCACETVQARGWRRLACRRKEV